MNGCNELSNVLLSQRSVSRQRQRVEAAWRLRCRPVSVLRQSLEKNLMAILSIRRSGHIGMRGRCTGTAISIPELSQSKTVMQESESSLRIILLDRRLTIAAASPRTGTFLHTY